MATKKNGINAYKDRMTSPIGVVQIDPKTRKPIKSGRKSSSKKK